MALNSWQKITRVLPGRPFGDGLDGSTTINGLYRPPLSSCSGTSGTTTLTVSDGTNLTNGSVVIIHQSRGTNVGQWEFNRISSGGETTTLTLQTPLQYTYTDSGASQAQVLRFYRYTNVTITSAYSDAWNENNYGILGFSANGTLTPNGAISVNSSGYAGGLQYYCTTDNATAYKGEGTSGASTRNDSNDRSANGNGGGPGRRGAPGYGCGGGGGGGHGTAGTAGQDGTGGDRAGAGGDTSGDSALTNNTMGGGGGGGVFDNTGGSGFGGNGGRGGGIVVIFAKNITTINSITANGENGQNWSGTAGNTGGGGGAGGSILICAGTVDIGTDKLSAVGGAGGTGRSYAGGAGGKGRIAIYYGSSLSGSVSSTYYGSLTTAQDNDLVETGGSFIFNLV